MYIWLKMGTVLIAVAATALVHYLNRRNTERRTLHYNTTSDRNDIPSQGKVFFTKKSLCGICSKKMDVTEGTRRLEVHPLRCGHEFHKDCLKEVFSEELKTKRTCPYRYCRAPVPEGLVSGILYY